MQNLSVFDSSKKNFVKNNHQVESKSLALKETRVIATNEELQDFCSLLATQEIVAVDTEFMRDITYYPQLCLIQLASSNTETSDSASIAAVIDVLTPGLFLDPFFELMLSEKVLKIFHAGLQDLEVIFHISNKLPYPVFDTQIAAAFCGMGESMSYGSLVQQITGHNLDKALQFSDWLARPLSPQHLAYAQADVLYLPAIYHKLRHKLSELGRLQWVMDETMRNATVERFSSRVQNAWKRFSLRKNNSQLEIALLKVITAWREEQAMVQNVPRSRIMKDATIFAMLNDLREGCMTDKDKHICELLEPSAIDDLWRKIQETMDSGLSRSRKLSDIESQDKGFNNIVSMLRLFLNSIAETNNLNPKLIATQEDLEAIALDDNADVLPLQSWRRDFFGNTALSLKKGELGLVFKKGKIDIY